MSDMTKAELEAELRQARDKICYCECKNKELQERLSAIVAPVQCDTYAEAVRAYGKQSQLVMAMEEMSELTKELSKNLRGADNSKALAEEIADVEIIRRNRYIPYRRTKAGHCQCLAQDHGLLLRRNRKAEDLLQ